MLIVFVGGAHEKFSQYQVASSAVAGGLSPGATIGAVFLGHVLVCKFFVYENSRCLAQLLIIRKPSYCLCC